MGQGSLCLVLHAHMPFVRHPEHEDFLEEAWLREAMLETYIPLLWVLESLADEGVPFRLTLSVSPTLAAMLADPLLGGRFVRRLADLCELAEREVARTRHEPAFQPTAVFHRDRLTQALGDYEQRWGRDLLGAMRRLSDAGYLELITCAATHGYLPLLAENPLAVRAQILVGVRHHARLFGAPPRGLWLPECGYYTGLDAVLTEARIRYTFLESHAIEHARGDVSAGVYAPIRSPSGLVVFGRDPESAKQVWSALEGYPGDPEYREYYRDIGFDLGLDELGPCAHPLGVRRNTGIKYYRVTGPTDEKQPYVRGRAVARALVHARDFCAKKRRQAAAVGLELGREPVIVAPYDAELFGHWWFEGPDWLGYVLADLARGSPFVQASTPSEYLARDPTIAPATPAASSWGDRGYSAMWLNDKTHWIYPHLHAAADRMTALALAHPHASGAVRRALDQAARELLLAQASDWAFIMTQGTVVEYAVRRTREHIARFRRLAQMVEASTVDEQEVARLNAQDNLFPELDYRVYRADYRAPAPG